MKKIILHLFTISFAWITIIISCKKEKSCEGCINGNKPPTAIAGPDQVITLPTDSVSLDGNASSDPDGTISEWLWTKISGPASFNIISASTAKTVVKNLVAGSYKFELKVKDDKGLFAKDTMQVIVDAVPTNHPPIANAGIDMAVSLPTNTVNLNGSASTDPDNNITSYVWTKISGPSSFNIVNANAVQTQVTNLAEGVYKFELKVTDAGALFSKDTIQVTVNSVSNQPCDPNILIHANCDNSMRPQLCAQLTPVGNLSVARSSMATASAGNKIFFAGGNSSRVDIYDLTTQTWSEADLCAARYDIAAVASGNKVFFGGGGTDQGLGAADSVDVYDVSTDTWTVTHLSAAGTGIAAAAVGDKVFFAGGDPELTGSDRASKVDIFDLTTNTWSTSLLSEGRSRITAVTANNKIYFAGGFGGVNSPSSKKIDIYDNATNTWTTSYLSEPKNLQAGIAIADKIYWAGGYSNNSSPSCTVEIKDLNSGNISIQYLFKPGAFIMNTSTNAVVKDNKIVFFRWPDPNVPTVQNDKFDIYDITTNTWSIGVLPVSINMAAIISVNNTIYIAGGFVNGVLTNQVWKLEF